MTDSDRGRADGRVTSSGTSATEERPWLFGIVRDAGTYRIVASGDRRARIEREIAHHSTPTMVVTREELEGLCISESEIRRWLPGASSE